MIPLHRYQDGNDAQGDGAGAGDRERAEKDRLAAAEADGYSQSFKIVN